MELHIPSRWADSAATIARHGWRKILVIGAGDRGKSTYCGFLSRHLLAAGYRVAVVDADVGQKTIGPPAAITLGYPETHQPLTAVEPAAWYFVGTVTPVGHLLPMVVGIKQLVEAAQARFVLVNTTGFVHAAGLALKSYIIEALRPDVIVALAQGAELQTLLHAYRNHRVLRLQPSPHATCKTAEQRRQARVSAFARYFRPAAEVRFSCTRLVFQRRELHQTSAGHLLCGVADWRNRCQGLALVREFDATRETLALLTPVPAQHIRIIQGGDLCLTPDGQELDRY